MAKNDRYYIKDILQGLEERFSDVCEAQENESGEQISTVYTNGRPSATDNHTEFLVISLSRSVYSHGPYQNAAIYIDIYARNGQGGIERTYRLQELLDAVTNKFPITTEDERWKATRPKLVIRGDDSLGFSAWRVRARLFVNTTDRYSTISDT